MNGRGPVVATESGAVRGLRPADTAVFRNIPYAAPPTGAARFAAPRPHARWDGVRDATAPGPNAPQGTRSLGRIDMSPYFGGGWHRGDDYLTVDVHTPATADGGLPVMVFVHGGGFVSGSTRAPLYDGSAFARDGVVLVTLNYRLGAAGFLDVRGAPANRGLLDVVAALRWVRANIGAFGGDPDRVTLFGQSAGATLVAAALAAPDAAGLFRRAIVQSGSGLGAFSPEQAARVTAAVAGALGIASGREPRFEDFAELPDARLVEAAGQVAGIDLRTLTHTDPLAGLSPFAPVLGTQPAEAVAVGRGNGVDLLIGTNSEEGNLYLVPSGAYAASTEADVLTTAARSHPDPAALVAAYRTARPGASHGALRAAVLGDALFGAGTWALASAHAGRRGRRRVTEPRPAEAGDTRAGATFRYEFTWRSPALGGALGATHGTELPFVFDVTHLPELRGENALLGPGEPPRELAARMHAAWVRFAASGNPGWAAYDDDRRTTMRIGAEWGLADDPYGAERRAW
ncbi:carboxylesterase family protein [Streptomyces sp. Z26]|uniref:carboxylesterase/lipase family protein n=1 Tax=Streptomyces sp. Z26 TaxID=2500177 RepID=UPI000EF13516|nr:carboxylesterase family protein [Streptomyces sp. Z26]RLL66179.1 carboxylesterase/lipase family protein [Streptomyces sp. Z26]